MNKINLSIVQLLDYIPQIQSLNISLELLLAKFNNSILRLQEYDT